MKTSLIRYTGNIIGYCLAGMFVMSVWGYMVLLMGPFGGFIAAAVLIPPLWYLNHYIGLIKHEKSSAWVDMGFAIGICGIARDVFMQGTDKLYQASPTILFVCIGAAIGGVFASLINKEIRKEKQE